MSASAKKKKKKGPILADKIEARRQKYGSQRLKRAIMNFFSSCDEDDNGYLEAHEFVIAQTVIAEIAGDAFDDEAAKHMFDDVRKFDKSGDNMISKEEFEQTMLELCEVIPRNADEIVNELAEKAALVVMQMRREMTMELRKFFKALDADQSGYLDQAEIDILIGLTKDCAKQTLGTGPEADAFLSLEGFDRTKDGKVEVSEFITHFLDWGKMVKLPKKDILAKLREYQAEAAEVGKQAT